MTNPVQWFSIQGPNGAALKRFYARALGWKLKAGPEGSGTLPAGDGAIPGNVGRSTTGVPSVTVYLTVKDLDAQLAKIERAGGLRAMPNVELPGGMGTIAGFIDPAGNWIGLWQKAPAPAPKRRPAKKAPRRRRRAV